ncbi:hypothetical protein NPIL_253701 [Nephila pilipes]|uniref:Uncharacterized protein n=1 Tax=Nephila pilipes TaxID=299642 RepID=A0A8X6T603_NEPPI|nr:hypothetical protein NPIL_253701 [Nephila pilipes]
MGNISRSNLISEKCQPTGRQSYTTPLMKNTMSTFHIHQRQPLPLMALIPGSKAGRALGNPINPRKHCQPILIKRRGKDQRPWPGHLVLKRLSSLDHHGSAGFSHGFCPSFQSDLTGLKTDPLQPLGLD